MPALRYALAAAVAAFALPPAMAAANDADAKMVDACLAAAADKGEFGVSCIGIVANPCIAAAKQKNSHWEDSKACAARELTVWTARLSAAVRSIERADRAQAVIVSSAQTSWSSSLSQLCPVFDNLDPGTSLGGADYCQMQETAMRVLVLDRLAKAAASH